MLVPFCPSFLSIYLKVICHALLVNKKYHGVPMSCLICKIIVLEVDAKIVI